MIFVAEGEFGTSEVEAESFQDAAEEIAERHAGLDTDEPCRDPWSFSLTSANKRETRVFVAEWNPRTGLHVTEEEFHAES